VNLVCGFKSNTQQSKEILMNSLDVRKLIGCINSAPTRQLLKRHLDTYEEAEWAFVDMNLALQTCELIIRREESRADEGELEHGESLIDGALAARAFTLYWEATSRADPRKSLDQAQTKRHLELRDVRTKVIAHREKHVHPTGSWHRGRTVLELTQGAADFEFRWERTNYFGSAILDMIELAKLIRSLYETNAVKRRDALGEAFIDALNSADLNLTTREDLLAAPHKSGQSYERRPHLIIDGLVDLDLPLSQADVEPLLAALKEAQNKSCAT
jgi:hypothetical protein